MSLANRVGVVGVAILPSVNGERRSLEELLYDVAQQALRDAGMTIEDIDGIVVASNDQYDGRAISVMAASGSVGGVDRDILSTPSAGEHAFVMGTLRVASGQYETQLVLSWSPTEASSLAECSASPPIRISTAGCRWTSCPRTRCRPTRCFPECPTLKRPP